MYIAEIQSESDGPEIEWIPAGSTMITFEMQPQLGGLVHMIQNVYVVKEYRKRGIFRSLYNYAVEQAKADPMGKAVRLYVDYDNDSAMEVYGRLGMQKMDTWAFDEIDFKF